MGTTIKQGKQMKYKQKKETKRGTQPGEQTKKLKQDR